MLCDAITICSTALGTSVSPAIEKGRDKDFSSHPIIIYPTSGIIPALGTALQLQLDQQSPLMQIEFIPAKNVSCTNAGKAPPHITLAVPAQITLSPM